MFCFVLFFPLNVLLTYSVNANKTLTFIFKAFFFKSYFDFVFKLPFHAFSKMISPIRSPMESYRQHCLYLSCRLTAFKVTNTFPYEFKGVLLFDARALPEGY